MTYQDPVFPLPDPSFLWVHDLIVWPVGSADDVEVDDEGRWRDSAGASVGFTGYLTAPDPRDVRRAAAVSEKLDAVALAPRDVEFTWPCYLEAAAASIPPLLRGWYTVAPPRPNASHTRLLLTRLPADPRPARAP